MLPKPQEVFMKYKIKEQMHLHKEFLDQIRNMSLQGLEFYLTCAWTTKL